MEMKFGLVREEEVVFVCIIKCLECLLIGNSSYLWEDNLFFDCRGNYLDLIWGFVKF